MHVYVCVCVCVCVCVYIKWNITQPLKKNEILPFAATWMGLEIITLSKSGRERQILYITYMWNLKK